MKMQLNPFGVRYKKPQVSTRKSLTHVRIRAQSKKIPITSQPELTAAHGNITLVATGLTICTTQWGGVGSLGVILLRPTGSRNLSNH